MSAVITVYSKPACPQCEFTKRHLTKLGVEHRVVDVTTDAAALATVRAMGYTAVPVVVTAAGESWSGFRPRLLDKLAGGVAA